MTLAHPDEHKVALDGVLLHIGYHKTASTWLQKKLFSTGSKVFEPVSLSGGGKTKFAHHFFCDKDGYLLSPFDSNETEIRSHLRHIIENNPRLGSRVPVISHERLSGNPHCGGFDAKKIALTLREIFPTAKVLIVIREQRSFLLSSYFQYLSVGGTHSLKKYLFTKYDHKRPLFSPHHVNYLYLVQLYFELFGPKNVLVLPYEMLVAAPAEFVSRLSNFVGKKIDLDIGLLSEKINYKSNKFVMYWMRWLNIFRKKTSLNDYSAFSNKVTKRLAEVLFLIFGAATPRQLDDMLKRNMERTVRLWVGDRYVAPNRELSQLIKIDLATYGYLNDS